ncbi:MAG: hypothetical protein A2785_01365 [Candidatus Chisholmbacteria bacterium RIFCSPHIGHO2_01_FULL_49_18]|uniref:PPM-type phosphatase domain-containing protein n=2 Tax=Candidatus Chisholmiibacteriota TaxID=1817900 RepID=A0A1G1VLH7_9BACT|nr:MAG: hypothetical protein A2785_01365 [Candidatus Chisholmbacteria bacterium RIFCSPHIGHO2_01_FULL_49_18]OGY21806.1 MAG: hypothetical protein A3A65_02455 [Candidatus Chisholmbacteria bacterium RIFCSPLOWO2_01_FULL_49_14]
MSEGRFDSSGKPRESSAGGGESVVSRVGGMETRGPMKEMQDTHKVLHPFGGRKDRSFFAVYDGHDRSEPSQIAAETFHTVFLDGLEHGLTAQHALTRAFAETNRRIDAAVPDGGGTTAVVAYLEGNRLIVGNVGDSRIIIDRGGSVERLTTDHRNEKSELIRSLGDKDAGEGVSHEPELREFQLGRGDRRLIIACDGLWDHVGDPEAVRLTARLKHPKLASEILMREAQRRGSRDDITVLVVDLDQRALKT